MSEEIKKMQEEQVKLLKELRDTVEVESKKYASEAKEKAEKIETRMNQLEEKNQELTKELQAAKEEALELNKKMSRSSGVDSKKESKHVEIFKKFVKSGEKNLSGDEIKYLRTDNAANGGVLVPGELGSEILKNITEMDAMRSIATVKKTSLGYYEFPLRTAGVTATWTGEGGTQTESDSTYGMKTVYTHQLDVYSTISFKMLNDAAFDMEKEITADISEGIMYAQGNAFVAGNGVKKPAGFTVNSTIQAAYTASGDANTISADGILNLTGALKVGYNPVFTLNRTTLALVRTLKDGSGAYVFQPGLNGAVSNTIAGYPYVILPSMPSASAGTYPIAFGDFKRGYGIVDGMEMYMIRDEYTQAKNGKVDFICLVATGGDVLLTEAIKLLKCSAS